MYTISKELLTKSLEKVRLDLLKNYIILAMASEKVGEFADFNVIAEQCKKDMELIRQEGIKDFNK